MRPMIDGLVLGWLSLATLCSPARADGGSLVLSEKRGGYQITVFTAPTPFRAGPVDISTLVQDASTGDLVTRAQVIVRMTKPGRLALEYPATFEAATNKLFRAAQFELPEPGRWNMQVEVDASHGAAIISGEIEAADPLPRWAEMLPWTAWPALAIVLFSIREVLARRADAIPSRRVAAIQATDRPVQRSHPPGSADPPSRQNRY
jgi:hypothetical protein